MKLQSSQSSWRDFGIGYIELHCTSFIAQDADMQTCSVLTSSLVKMFNGNQTNGSQGVYENNIPRLRFPILTYGITLA